jgi:hypothetical protein
MNFYYKIIYDKIIYYRSHFGSSLINMYSNMKKSYQTIMELCKEKKVIQKKVIQKKKVIIFEPVFYIKILLKD